MSEWISVKDRLPEGDQECLFFQNDEYEQFGCGRIKIYINGNFGISDIPGNCGCSGLYWHKVTHWMPLPKPPKGEPT